MPALDNDFHKVTIEEYMTACSAGAFAQTELINGLIYNMAPLSSRHSDVQDYLRDWLKTFCKEVKTNGTVTDEKTAEREPDVFVLDRLYNDKKYFHPDEVPLAIEVACSTLARDKAKIEDYARLNIPIVWIVDLESRQKGIVEYSNLKKGVYKSIKRFDETDSIIFKSQSLSVKDALK